MRQLPFWSILISIAFTCCSILQRPQQTPEQLIKEMDELDESDSECGPNKAYKPEERLKFYPFNKAKKVVIISFDETTKPENITPVIARRIIDSLVKERVSLNSKNIDDLTYLLYNIGYKNPNANAHVIDHASCFNPRNAIVFLDSYNNVIDYISICFECRRHELSSKKIKEINYCTDKYALLAKFFYMNGVKLGARLE